MSDADYGALMREIDPNGDGSVTYAEFLAKYGKSICGDGFEGMTVGADANAQLPELAAAQPGLGAGADRRVIKPRDPHWTPAMVRQVIGARLAAKGRKVGGLFRAIDKDASGTLSHAEFRRLLAGMNIAMSDRDFVAFIHTIDKDMDGDIHYAEFLKEFGEDIAGDAGAGLATFMNPAGGKKFADPRPAARWTVPGVSRAVAGNLATKGRRTRAVFASFDKLHTGALGARDFREALARLNVVMVDADFEALMRAADPHASGQVFYKTFLDVFGAGAKPPSKGAAPSEARRPEPPASRASSRASSGKRWRLPPKAVEMPLSGKVTVTGPFM